MSNYIFDMPHGGELVADPPTWAWGSDFMTASPEAVAICRDNGFRELSAEDVDFERTTHRKFYVKGEPGYYRYHRGSLDCAVDSGVSAYFVMAPGYLVLIERPNSEKVKSERLGDVPVGREAEPGLRIRQPVMPGQSPALPRR